MFEQTQWLRIYVVSFSDCVAADSNWSQVHVRHWCHGMRSRNCYIWVSTQYYLFVYYVASKQNSVSPADHRV